MKIQLKTRNQQKSQRLNGVNEKGLSKDNRVKVKNFPGVTTETILEEPS